MPRIAPAVLFLLVALVGKTLVKESEGLAKPLLQPPSGPSQDFTAGRALAMEQMREVAARPPAHACRARSSHPARYPSLVTPAGASPPAARASQGYLHTTLHRTHIPPASAGGRPQHADRA